MNEPDIIGYAVGIFITLLFCGVVLFIAFVPQIDRWLEKMKKKRAAA